MEKNLLSAGRGNGFMGWRVCVRVCLIYTNFGTVGAPFLHFFKACSMLVLTNEAPSWQLQCMVGSLWEFEI